ncbi:hypothetical protein [Nocardia salmonicida]|uniref:hypothetical protein n=1 Tax=Nocardia salmonicida TaxID=53431 RepID=UPI003636A994
MTSGRDLHQEPAQWSDWMHRIQNLAADVSRFHESGTMLIGESDPADPPRQVRQQANRLDAALDDAEQQARAAGLDLTWIHDARTVGSQQGASPHPGAVRRVPMRELGIERFFLDLLDLDLWQLERMAALDMALPVRAAAGHGVITGDSARDLALFERMHVRYSRASSLVAAVQLTPEEGDRMWRAGAELMRRMHAAAIDQMSDVQLLGQWQEYADADARLRMPPNCSQDPDTGKVFLADSLTEPPSPRQMIARAALTLFSRDPEGADHPGVS